MQVKNLKAQFFRVFQEKLYPMWLSYAYRGLPHGCDLKHHSVLTSLLDKIANQKSLAWFGCLFFLNIRVLWNIVIIFNLERIFRPLHLWNFSWNFRQFGRVWRNAFLNVDEMFRKPTHRYKRIPGPMIQDRFTDDVAWLENPNHFSKRLKNHRR